MANKKKTQKRKPTKRKPTKKKSNKDDKLLRNIGIGIALVAFIVFTGFLGIFVLIGFYLYNESLLD
ncbi:hypothetical protein LCGC14_0495440 [marine sediment metagenome]|uniref:Uncharacterized protein n=1 Tax=marine sediment metagenome TaxID=412755 RepID=A0A0F9SP00_9ZZZZ|nr:hypothetical protein [bacterium]